MAERRGLLDRIFGRRLNDEQQTVRLELVTGYGSAFSEWGKSHYEAEVVRSAVDAVARNTAKLRGRHIRRVNGAIAPPADTRLAYLLAVRPNPNMSAYDFLYKLTTTLLVENNVFIYPDWTGTQLTALWLVNCSRAEFLNDEAGVVYVRFWMRDGKPKTLPYSEVLHLRRHFFKSELAGESNAPLDATLNTINVVVNGMAQAVKSSAHLRGLLKFIGMLKPDDIKKQRDEFVKDYLTVDNSGGVAAIDQKTEYTELKNTPVVLNATQMIELRNAVYRYFGVSEKIVTATYNEDEWNAFYESVIEPIAVALSLECTEKLFTARERGHGNEIVFESNRLQYASVSTKLDLREMVDRGALTPNEWREAFNLGPVEGGDKPLRRLDTGVVGEIKGGDDDGGNGDQEGAPPSGASGE